MAAVALGELGDVNAHPALAAALVDEDREVLLALISAVRELGHPEAAEELRSLLCHSSTQVQDHAVRELEALGWEPEAQSEKALCAVLQGRWDEARACGALAVAPAVRRYHRPGKEAPVRKLLEDLCQDESPGLAEALRPHLDAYGRKVQRLVLDTICSSHSEASTQLLLQLWDDPRSEVRGRVSRTLLQRAHPAAIERHLDAREYRALALGGARAIPLLLEAMRARPPVARRAIVEVLGRIGSPIAVEGLLRFLDGADRQTRHSLARTLHGLGYRPEEPATAVEFALAGSDWKALDAMGAASFEHLLAALRGNPALLQTRAARSLARIDASRALAPLLELWSDRPMSSNLTSALSELGWKPESDNDRARFALAENDWPALVELGPAALEILASSPNAEPIVRTMAEILENHASAVQEEQLRALSERRDLFEREQVVTHDGLGGMADVKKVDWGPVRERALQELERRGRCVEKPSACPPGESEPS